jgi:3-oxoacyl-ACP reductase-like protein
VFFVLSVPPATVPSELCPSSSPLPSEPALFEGIDFYTSLTRGHFVELSQGPFRYTLGPIDEILRDSKIDQSNVPEIILYLTGASALIVAREVMREGARKL